jgi:pimeloyl-ACP methyl ester carboxylesterase
LLLKIKKTGLFIILIYCIACITIYFLQTRMLFPAYLAQPVPENWQPTAGESAIQTLIEGSCGKIHAVIWKIKQPKGTILMFHGNGESLASIDDYAHKFLSLGYNLMTWDYPNYGRSSACLFSQTELLNDAETAYQWLSTKEKPEKIVIFGYSIGTGIAVNIASQHPQHDVYLVAAYDSLLNVAKAHTSNLLPINLIMRYPLPAVEWIKKIKGNVHILHGLNDTLIQPKRAKALFDIANKNTDIEWVKNAGHAHDNLFLYRNAWMQRHLTRDKEQIAH